MSKHTVQLQSTLEAMSLSLERAAKDLRRLSVEVGQDEAFSQVSEAVMIVQNLYSGLPLDRLINLPVDALSLRLLEAKADS
jgi:hypothetical protein